MKELTINKYYYIVRKEDMFLFNATFETEIFTSKKRLIKEITKLINAGHDVIRIEKTNIIDGERNEIKKSINRNS